MNNHHVQIIPIDIARRIRERLEQDGFRLGAAPYADFEAVGSDVRVTYYPKRSKLLLQGAGTEGLLLRLRDLLGEPSAEAADLVLGLTEPTIGSDESGKGDYFGSLVVAGCLVTPEDVPGLRQLGVRDSKDAGEQLIRAAEGRILDLVPVAVCELEPEEYGELHQQTRNVNRILGIAHARVIRELLGTASCRRVVVDRFGGEHYVKEELGDLAAGLTIIQVPRAEQNPAVAAASFIARATFLRSLSRLSDEVGVDLIPGASAEVEEVARKVYAVGGKALLGKVAKLHFKTTERVIPRW